MALLGVWAREIPEYEYLYQRRGGWWPLRICMGSRLPCCVGNVPLRRGVLMRTVSACSGEGREGREGGSLYSNRHNAWMC